MGNKINIAKLLKDCLRGMELDCTICNGVKFIELDRNPNFPIVVRANNGYEFSLTKYGQVHNIDDAKCVIFPKGKTTWEGFQRPFKDGDIVAVTMIPEGVWTGIFKQYSYNKTAFESHCSFSTRGEFCGKGLKNHGLAGLRLATEEEKQKLFDTIKAKGYKWNAETKTLEKLIIPKFKVGDKIRHKTTNKDYIYEISKVYDDSYGLVDIYWTIYMTYQDHYELVPNKFDITTLKPFDKVLVAHQKGEWHIQFFEKYSPTSKFPFICIGGSAYQRCVPYGDNKHLMNTTNDCDEYYKTWE